MSALCNYVATTERIKSSHHNVLFSKLFNAEIAAWKHLQSEVECIILNIL